MKKLFKVILVTCIFLGGSLSVSASSWEVRDFTGLVGHLSIMVNGKPMETTVKPFILQDEGVTMVSLRDLSEALGFTVSWEEATSTINITGIQAFVPAVLSEYWANKPKRRIEDLKVIRNVGPFYQRETDEHKIAGRRFEHGVAVDLGAYRNVAEMVLDLNRKYSTFEGFYGVEDKTMNSTSTFILTILGDDRVIFTSGEVSPSDHPRYFTPGLIDLTAIDRLTFRISIPETEEERPGDFDNLTAVLANMLFYLK